MPMTDYTDPISAAEHPDAELESAGDWP